PHSMPIRELVEKYFDDGTANDGPVTDGTVRDGSFRKHRGYVVVDDSGSLMGIVTRSNLLDRSVLAAMDVLIVADILQTGPLPAYTEESCRSVAERMAQAKVERLPVVTPEGPHRVVGIVTPSDLLKARARRAEEEYRRERFISSRLGLR